MPDRDRIRQGNYVIFRVDNFYEFARELWNLGFQRESVTIEDFAEKWVEK